MKTNFQSNRIFSIHPRKQNNFEQAAILSELFPERFSHITTIYVPPAFLKFLRRISPRFASLMGKRSYSKLSKKYVRTLPLTEVKKFLLERKGDVSQWEYLDLNEFWQKSVLKHFKPPEICISFDGSSNLIFRSWKNISKLILDLTIGLPQYRMKIMHGDHFDMAMLNNMDEVRARLFAVYREEVELADIILCGSEFTKKTVVYFYPEFENKCKVLPYAADFEEFSYPERKFDQKENLKFVFTGRLSWRKGADLLLDAWKDFVVSYPKSELHFFGIPDKEIDLNTLPKNVFVHGWTKTSDLISALKTMDIFVFPTTFEGSSYALYQAMALKIPVITTLNSGTVLEHGESCEIVEVGDKAGLVKAMTKLFNNLDYRQILAEKGYILSKNYTWDDYRIRLKKILREASLY